jgi:hypothetical protein
MHPNDAVGTGHFNAGAYGILDVLSGDLAEPKRGWRLRIFARRNVKAGRGVVGRYAQLEGSGAAKKLYIDT